MFLDEVPYLCTFWLSSKFDWCFSSFRECDSDAELKGSASTSLMKSIIGPSGNSSSKASGHFQGVTSSLQGMGMLGGRNLNMYLSQSSLGAAVPPAPQSTSSVPTLGDAASITDMLNLNDMFDMLPQSLNQLFSSSDTLNVSANSVNYTMAGATNSVTMPSSASSSSHTTWSSASSLKMAGGTMEQPQLQRSLSMAHSNMSGPRPLSLNFQRSASLFDNGQKSPAFTGTPGQRTCSPNFAMPSPRGPGYGSYMNQRSPGSANQGDANRASSQFSPMSYPQAKSTSPLMSPQPSKYTFPPCSTLYDTSKYLLGLELFCWRLDASCLTNIKTLNLSSKARLLESENQTSSCFMCTIKSPFFAVGCLIYILMFKIAIESTSALLTNKMCKSFMQEIKKVKMNGMHQPFYFTWVFAMVNVIYKTHSFNLPLKWILFSTSKKKINKNTYLYCYFKKVYF